MNKDIESANTLEKLISDQRPAVLAAHGTTGSHGRRLTEQNAADEALSGIAAEML